MRAIGLQLEAKKIEPDSLPTACRECGNVIADQAKLCSACNSYQDWRRFFPFSGVVLAMLTALVSVLTVAVPTLYKLVHTPRSAVTLENPSLDGTLLRVVAVNRGDAPAVVYSAKIQGDYLAGATKVRLRNDSEAIIPPGSKQLIFDVIPLLDEDQSYQGSLEALTATLSKKPLPQTSIAIGVTQSDGQLTGMIYHLSDNDMFLLMRENADRCSAVDKPNFLNGCIGNGSPDEAVRVKTSDPTKK